MSKTKVAIMGTGYVVHIHLESYRRFVHDAEVVAVYGRTAASAKTMAEKFNIPKWYDDMDKFFAETDAEVVDICLPNYLHHTACMKAAEHGKHVIVEKPFAMTLEEADEMIAACKAKGLKLMYGEQLCFCPKYERLRAVVESGAIGDVYMVKQAEKHDGPHGDWFYKKEFAGGGALMDLGCHAIAWFRWMTKNAKVKTVFADMKTVLHKGRTDCEDNVICIVEFENGVVGVAEDSWARHGGMDDQVEVFGTKGSCTANLFRGNSFQTYSKDGYDYASEKAGDSKGWTFTIFEEDFNQGYPIQLQHFIKCVRENLTPVVTGEDGRAVLEIIYAAYESARTGQKVALPFHKKVKYPIELWLGK
jgi:predicted dehydrogenase